MPPTIEHEHSLVAYLDLGKELYDARGSIGKLRAVKEELIAKRVNAFVYNLGINSKIKDETTGESNSSL